MIDLEVGGWVGVMLHQTFLGIRAELGFFFFTYCLCFSLLLSSPLTYSHFFYHCFFLQSGWLRCSYPPPPLSQGVIVSGPVVSHRGSEDVAFIKHLYCLLVCISPFSSSLLLCPPSVCWMTSLPLGSLTLLLWPWPCPPWVIYHGPGGEPPGLQAPVSLCNRLFVAPSKQVSDQQKSIKAWWAFLNQLGSGHWAALLAAPRALCVAAVRWHRSPQD